MVSRINTVSDWASVIASAALLRASDALSNQRALGIVFLANCSVTNSDLARFSTFVGRASGLLQLSISFEHNIALLFQTSCNGNGSVLQQYVANMTSYIVSPDFPRLCHNTTRAQLTAMTIQWKDSFQTYITQVIDDIRINYVIAGIVKVCLLIYMKYDQFPRHLTLELNGRLQKLQSLCFIQPIDISVVPLFMATPLLTGFSKTVGFVVDQ